MPAIIASTATHPTVVRRNRPVRPSVHAAYLADDAIYALSCSRPALGRPLVDSPGPLLRALPRGFDLRLNSAVERVSAVGARVRLDLATPSGGQRAEAEVLLVAAGRRPNSDLLDVAAAGIKVDAHGHVRTDDTMQTSVPGIWALGDLANHFQLKHMANAEARVVWHNIAHPASRARLPSRSCRPRCSPKLGR